MELLEREAHALRRSTHTMNRYIADFVMSEEFMRSVREIDSNPARRAALMVELLKVVALDPTAGSKPTDFYSRSGAEVSFNLRLDRVINPLGSLFFLSIEDAHCVELMKAVKRNLESRMFKAAKMHRRLDNLAQRAMGRYSDLANKAYQRVRLHVTGRLKSEHREHLTENDLAEMDRAFDEVYAPLKERLWKRMGKVAEASSPGLYNSSYTNWLASFLYLKLPEVSGM